MTGSRVRILLIEDDPDISQSYSRFLEESGFHVDTALTGQQAIDMMHPSTDDEYDVIVSDIQLPDITGTTVLEHVRRYNKDIPFIFTTAYPSMETAIDGINHGGIFGYLVKPIDPSVLINKVRRAAHLHMLQRLSMQAAEASSMGQLPVNEQLSTEFDSALQSLWMAYQPIISARERRILAYEALVRNQSDALRAPPDLIDAARALGRMQDLGRIIRTRVAEDLLAQSQHLDEGVLIFVNINPSDLSDPTLTTINDEPLLSVSDRVVFEVTERSSLHAVRNLEEAREALRDLGYRVAVDDLGQGHAGLSSLLQLDPEFVKLDMMLVRNIHRDLRRQKIVGSMFQLCRSSNMGVIAEGVETEEEHNTLLQLGADLLQGYLYARPGAGFPLPKIP